MNTIKNLGLLLCAAALLHAQPPPFVALGDSIGEGVQSYDASSYTQPNSYLNLLANQMGVPFPLPLIDTSIIGMVSSTTGRSRHNPTVQSYNLAISGTNSTTILTREASPPVDDETDLVLLPRTSGSQISVAESLHAPFMVCWIGNNDVLDAVISFDHLDASQITPVKVFNANYDQISSRLSNLGGKLVFANIPDVRQIGFLFGRQDLIDFLGSDYGLPEGSYTSVVAMLLIKTGLNDGSILQNPNWVLDPTELQTVTTAVTTFNQIIAAHAAQVHAPVVDVNALFRAVSQNPPTIGNLTLTPRYLGGMFSLDGVHPSNIGHAIVANAFIQTINGYYHWNIPPLNNASLLSILQYDPFVDFNHDQRVRGRFGAGLLETLAPFLGISGDRNDDFVPNGLTQGQRFMQAYLALKGKDPNSKWTEQDAIEAMRDIFRFK